MSNHDQALALLKECNKRIQRLGIGSHNILVAAGCKSYVKTIYVGYEINGEMIAALYPRSDHLEVALALPEEANSRLLVDASHLTWRTLPLAALVRGSDDVPEFTELAKSAVDRVRTARHDAMRDNESFVRTRRERGRGSPTQT